VTPEHFLDVRDMAMAGVTAAQMQLQVLDLIQWWNPGKSQHIGRLTPLRAIQRWNPGKSQHIGLVGRLTPLRAIQLYCREYGRRAGVLLWFDVESARDL
jgi:hypothetical protein